VADGAPIHDVERMGFDDHVRALAPLRRCASCGRRKARASDGFCGGCGAKPSAAAYETYQTYSWSERSKGS